MSVEDSELSHQQRADVVLNRTNLALARSQSVIRSWITQESGNVESQVHHNDSGGDNDETEAFNGMSELGGLGARTAIEHEDSTFAGLRRSKLSSNDKLLEQLLGKKAVQVRRKAKERESAAEPAKMNARNPRTGQRNAEESEDEGGRTVVLNSRKPHNYEKIDADASVDPNAMKVSNSSARTTSPRDVRQSRKRKPASFLDEILAKKVKKNEKNKLKADP